MDKNKSIDGLVPRRSKTSATAIKSAPKTNSASISPSKPKAKPAKSTSVKNSSAKTTRPNRTTRAKSAPRRNSTPKAPAKEQNPKIDQLPSDTTSLQPTDSAKIPLATAEDFLSPVQTFDFDEQTGELKAAKDQAMNNDNKKTKNPKKEKKPISKKRKVIVGLSLVLVILMILAVTAFIIVNNFFNKIGDGGNIFSLFTETYEPLKTDKNGRTNILAFGTSGYDMAGTEGAGVHDGAQLTDSIMVISLDQETGDVAMLSLPRDLKVSRTCTATSKINEIYWCNNMEGDNEQAGAEALTQEVSEILGVDFQYYAHLNWGSLVSIVNILDGITVTLDEDIEDYTYTKAVFEAGTPYTINGEQALGLARARHGTASGDFSRGASQQKILIGIKDRITEKQLSITDLLDLAGTLSDNFRSNFTVEEMKTIAHLITDLDFDSIRQISLIEPEKLMTTGTINGISYVIPSGGANYYSRIQEYVAKMFSSDPRKYEDSTILILNGTETPGIASAEQATLEEAGYVNIDIDDAPAGNYTEHYTLYATNDDNPGTKALLEEKYGSAHSLEELPAGISQEYDFVIIIGDQEVQE